jgi:lipopolysaccharide export system protein LptA
MSHRIVQIALLWLCIGFALPTMAARADSFQPLQVEADKPGKIDLKKNIVEFNGRVVVTKGSLTLQASHIEIRETPGGHHMAIALGSAANPARFRQKREGLNEFIEGVAERLEYDSQAETVQFIHHAAVRRLRGSQVADEISGERVIYNNRTEVFNVTGSESAQNPSRVRAVLTPRVKADEALLSPSKGRPKMDLTPSGGLVHSDRIGGTPAANPTEPPSSAPAAASNASRSTQ